jgi:large subunit ribosomal protein L13
MKTYAPTPGDIERRWYVVDADGAVLGRLASEVAQVLRGKHKPMYAPHMDTGDHVIVVNARGVRLTGGKEQQKVAYRHSGYPGGLKETGYERLMAQRPGFVVEKAIKGMLPKTRLGRAMARKLLVYEGAEHPHEAQKPQLLGIGELPAWTGLPERAAKPAAKPAATRPGPKTEPSGRAAKAPATNTTRAKRAKSGRATGTAAKRTAAKRTAAKRTAAKRTAAKRTAAKPTAARSTRAKASSAKGTSTKSTAAAPKRTRRPKKEEG